MGFWYNTAIRAFDLAVSAGAVFHKKARLLRDGRRDLLSHIERSMSDLKEKHGGELPGSIWIHCASLGEFEQGLPLIEAFRAAYPVGTPDYRPLILTFFSPSGYRIRKDYPGVDQVFYLPSDTPAHARRFIRATRPCVALFVKYEYWYNYLDQLAREKVPSYVVSAIFSPRMSFFKKNVIGRQMRRMLRLVTGFFVQDQASADLLRTIGIERNVVVSGDTRFDRVCKITREPKHFPLIERFARDSVTVVCGSTWPEDEALILDLMDAFPDFKFIIAPHEIDRPRMEHLADKSGRKTVFYTQSAHLPADELENARLFIVDTIGILSSVYQYGLMAYIGGGFGRGIHNILEAATWGKPLLFGPYYKKFQEAKELVTLNAAHPVNDSAQAIEILDTLARDGHYEALKQGEIARDYVRSKIGATAAILPRISAFIEGR